MLAVMRILHIILSSIVLLFIGVMLGLMPFFVFTTGEIPLHYYVILVLVVAIIIAFLWYLIPFNTAGVRPRGVQIFIILFPLVIAWGVYHHSTASERLIEKNMDPEEQTYTIVVDYDQPYSTLFKRDTYHQGWSGTDVRDLITPENFPIEGTGRKFWELKIIKMAVQASYRDIREVLAADGYTVAGIEHLMALHDMHPDLHLFNQGSIYAFGSEWTDENGQQRIPALDTGASHILRVGFLDSTSIPTDDWFAVIEQQ